MEGVNEMIDYKELGERCLSTFLQATVATLSADQVLDMGVNDWKLLLASGFAGVLSVIKGSCASIFGMNNSCSVLRDKTAPESDLNEMIGE